MRISSYQVHTQATNQLQTLGAQAAATQQQIAQGKRLVNPSDDPIGAARVIRINQELAAREQYLVNADAAEVQLGLTDSVLKQMESLIQRMQELTLQAGSGVQTPEDRTFIAQEIFERFEELMALANTRNTAGEYIFSGFQGGVEPFVRGENGIEFQGDDGAREVKVNRDQLVAINDSGAQVFMDVPARRVQVAVAASNSADGEVRNLVVTDQSQVDAFFPDKLVVEFRPPSEAGGFTNYTVRRASDNRPLDGAVNVPLTGSGTLDVQGVSFNITGSPQEGDAFVIETSDKKSVFATVQDLADGLLDIDPAVDPQAFEDLIDNTIVGLENASNGMSLARSGIGARFNTIAASRDLHEDLALQLKTVRSDIEDLDFSEAVSDLAYQSFVLEAAQQSFIRINGLSLFNRL